jgi:diaminopimelate epimerase
MFIDFYKYEGAANDFIMIADPADKIEKLLDIHTVSRLCHRRRGIGADGVILLQKAVGYDFKMVYYNSDGHKSSMCGNGGRCIMAFAARLGWVVNEANFLAIDGAHKAFMVKNTVSLQMQDVLVLEKIGEDWLLDTGSPHYVKIVKRLEAVNVFEQGCSIRYSPRFKTDGVNVNFMQYDKNNISIATYERGVEGETWACGTGATACGLISHLVYQQESPALIKTKGGDLCIKFVYKNNRFTDIWLEGGANFVYRGRIGLEVVNQL